MSRPVLLVFLLVILIITSQFEWKQQLVPDLDATPSISQKPSQSSKREEAVKEKVISICYSIFDINIVIILGFRNAHVLSRKVFLDF